MRGRLVGIVQAWDRPAYGFIRVADQAAFFFVHRESVDRGEPLRAGELVEFTPSESGRGPRAERVRRLPPECRKCGAALHGLRCGACGFLVGT